MPDLTAHDLYELVKGLPEEARPPVMQYHPGGAVPHDWSLRTGEQHVVGWGPVPIENAILLHEASVMRWLVKRRGPWMELCGLTRGRFTVKMVNCSGRTGESYTGPTLLHALVAAAEGVE